MDVQSFSLYIITIGYNYRSSLWAYYSINIHEPCAYDFLMILDPIFKYFLIGIHLYKAEKLNLYYYESYGFFHQYFFCITM